MKRVALALLLSATSLACTSESAGPDDDTTEDAVVAGKVGAAAVKAAIAKLDAQRNGAALGRYYESGDRVEGCFKNPAGNKLTDLKKTVYCAMPLELRLCNTVVLLTRDEADVDGRYRGYLDCKKRVTAAMGGRVSFEYGADIDAVYKQIVLEGRTLSAAETREIVAAHGPPTSPRSFPVVLAAIGRSLAEEVRALGLEGLAALAREHEAKTGLEPR